LGVWRAGLREPARFTPAYTSPIEGEEERGATPGCAPHTKNAGRRAWECAPYREREQVLWRTG